MQGSYPCIVISSFTFGIEGKTLPKTLPKRVDIHRRAWFNESVIEIWIHNMLLEIRNNPSEQEVPV